MSLLNLGINLLAFDDEVSSNNPSLRSLDWKRTLLGLPVVNPKSDSRTIQSLSEETIFDGSVSTLIDNTSVFSLTLSGLDSTTYRITNTSGTAPAFRTDRAIAVASTTITVAVLANSLVTFTSNGTPFGAAVVGDTVFIPGTTTGDATSPFSYLNEGNWVVVAKTTSMLTVSRLDGTIFSAIAEGPISVASNSQFQVYSSTGVQIGDIVEISGGFQVNARKAFPIVSVTASRIEISSTVPLATESSITPTTANISLYRGAKRFVYVEGDQECVVRLNGDSGSTCRISPLTPADASLRGIFFKIGTVWKITILNKSTASLAVKVMTAE